MRVLASKEFVFQKVRLAVTDGTPAERAARLVTFLIVALGIWMRCRGYLFSTMPLWLDEANWAIKLIDKPLSEHLIRPIGFMALSKALVRVLSPSETVLRFMPWAAGVATALMAPRIGARLFRSTAARLLFVAILCLDPVAIDLTREFKPYSVGLALHAGLMLLALRYCRSGTAKDLVWLLSIIGISILFAQDAMFAYPGLFLVIGIEAIRGRRFKHLAAVAGAALATMALVLSLYFFIWSRLNQSKEAKYWGKKYDVFFVSTRGGPNKAEWTLDHYAALAATAGSRREIWESRSLSKKTLAELASLDQALWLVLNIAGIVVIVRDRRGREALLVVLPVGVIALFNWLGFWPFGPFRTNLFSLVYIAAAASFAVEGDSRRARFVDLLSAAVFVLLPLFLFERVWHAKKEMLAATSPSEFPRALTELLALQGADYSGPKEKIVMDTMGCDVFRYYTKYHPTYSKSLGGPLRHRFELRCSGGKDRTAAVLSVTRKLLARRPRVWIVATDEGVIQDLDQSWPEDLEKTALYRTGENLHVVIGVKRAEVPQAPVPEGELPPESETHELPP